MHRAFQWTAAVALVAALVATAADDRKPKPEPPTDKADKPPASPADQLKALEKEYSDAQKEFSILYGNARTDEEKQKVLADKYPQPQKFAARFVKLAQDHPKDPAAVDALVWVCQRVRSGPERQKALDILLKDHLKSEKLGPIVLTLGGNAAEREALRTLMKENPHRSVQGPACYALALSLKSRAGDTLPKEAEELLERIVKEYADVGVFGRKLGDMAKRELFEARNLSVGKLAPDIEGEDIDGKSFKLSDYRGKVVLLDFWGNW